MMDKTLIRLPHKVDRFVPGGKNVHMPRNEFLRLLCFNGWRKCHLCGQTRYLVVDHDHSRCSNNIRGLLCDPCNILVGRFEHGHHFPSPLKDRIKSYLDNPPALQLGILRHYKPYYPQQNESEKIA